MRSFRLFFPLKREAKPHAESDLAGVSYEPPANDSVVSPDASPGVTILLPESVDSESAGKLSRELDPLIEAISKKLEEFYDAEAAGMHRD